MTNFTSLKFDKNWNAIHNNVSQKWSGKRGRKSTYNANDMFFMSLCVLKHCQQYDLTAELFSSSSCFKDVR